MKKITDIGYMGEFFRKNEVVRAYDEDGNVLNNDDSNLSDQEKVAIQDCNSWKNKLKVDVLNTLDNGYFMKWSAHISDLQLENLAVNDAKNAVEAVRNLLKKGELKTHQGDRILRETNELLRANEVSDLKNLLKEKSLDTVEYLCKTLIDNFKYDENLIYSKFGNKEIQKIVQNLEPENIESDNANFAKKINLLIKNVFLNKSA